MCPRVTVIELNRRQMMPAMRPTPLESACPQHSIHAIKFDIIFARIGRTNVPVPVPRIIHVGTATFLKKSVTVQLWSLHMGVTQYFVQYTTPSGCQISGVGRDGASSRCCKELQTPRAARLESIRGKKPQAILVMENVTV